MPRKGIALPKTSAKLLEQRLYRTSAVKNKLLKQALYQKERYKKSKEKRERRKERRKERERLGDQVWAKLATDVWYVIATTNFCFRLRRLYKELLRTHASQRKLLFCLTMMKCCRMRKQTSLLMYLTERSRRRFLFCRTQGHPWYSAQNSNGGLVSFKNVFLNEKLTLRV